MNSPLLDSGLELSDPEINVPIIHEDQDLIVVDKPSGLVVHPATGLKGTLVNGLLSYTPKWLQLVNLADTVFHRLDKELQGSSLLRFLPRLPRLI